MQGCKCVPTILSELKHISKVPSKLRCFHKKANISSKINKAAMASFTDSRRANKISNRHLTSSEDVTRNGLDHRFPASLEDLSTRVVHSDDHLVGINKDAGLSVHGSSTTGNVSLSDSLPELSHKLQVPNLQVGISLKSFYSGLVLLCKSRKSKAKLEQCLREAVAKKVQLLSYLAITVGVPNCPLDTDLSCFIARDYLHNREMSIIKDENNSSARKAGSMMLASYKVRNLDTNLDLGVSLVEVLINKDRWESVEALLSHHHSPVLGDHIYSSRTHHVMGVPFRLAAHAAAPGPQRLPKSIQESLEDYESSGTEHTHTLPLFLHRHKITLDKFPESASPPLIVTAPPLKQFMEMAKHFGLDTHSFDDLRICSD